MAKKKKRQFTRTSAANVFVAGDRYKNKVSWRLDVDQNVDLNSGHLDSDFFFKRRGRQVFDGKNRLFRYISAGGMRQMKRTTVDDLIEYRKRRFLFLMLFFAVFWLVFYIMPSV